MTASPPTSDSSASGLRSTLDRRRRLHRQRGWALAISAVIHLVALALYPRLFGGLPPGPLPGPQAPELPLEGIELVNLIEVSDPASESPPEPIEETERQPVPVPVRPTADEPADESAPVEAPVEDQGGRTAVERLQPRVKDGRLWAPLPPEITALTSEQQIQNLLYARFFAMRDSLEAAGEVGPNLDWTHTDSDGNKWGVSPGKLHLGPITLPMPFGFSAPHGGASGDLLRRLEMEAEIRRAAGQAEVDQTAEERAEAIRRRREAERRRPPPDTTSGGGGAGG